MISAGLETATTAIKRLHTYVLDRTTTHHSEKRVSTCETWLFTGLCYWFWILALVYLCGLARRVAIIH